MSNRPHGESVIRLAKEMAKGGGLTFSGSIVGRIMRLTLQVLLGHVLGVGLYGIYALGTSVAGIAQSVSSLGVQNGMVRFGAMYLGEGDKSRVKGVIYLAIGISLISSVVVSTLLFFFSENISMSLFGQERLIGVLKVFAVAIPFCALVELLVSFAQSARRIDYQVGIENVFRPFVNVLVVGVAFILGFRLSGAVYGYLISAALSAILGFRFLLRFFPEVKSTVVPVYGIGQFARYSLATFMVGISATVLSYVDRIMLGYFGQTSDVGIYNAAAVVAVQIIIFLSAFVGIFSPIVSDLCNKGGYEQLSSLFRTVTRWIFCLTLPLFIIVVVFSKNIMSIFGADFVGGAWVLIILSLSQLINAVTGPGGRLLQMSGRQNIELINGMCLLLLNIGLNIWLIPLYGVLGAAVATAISIVLVNIAKLIEVILIFKMMPYDRYYLKPVAAGLLMSVLLYVFCKENRPVNFEWLWLLMGAFLSLGIYAGIIYLMGLNPEDRLVLAAVKTKFTLRNNEGGIFKDMK